MAKKKTDMQMDALKAEMGKPRITFTDSELPAITDWEVGEKYEVEMKVKMIGQRMEGGDMIGTFEVLSAESED